MSFSHRFSSVPLLCSGLFLSSVAFAQTPHVTGNAFNPAFSLILNGGFTAYGEDPETYELAGFPLGGEAGLFDEGFTVFETELTASANVDDLFYGSVTLGLHQEGGEVELDVEEAYLQTLGLGRGFTIKAGKFFSDIGYLNAHHLHAHDFADFPLVYRGLLGRQFSDTGAQVSWIAPTDTYLRLGGEWLRGEAFPTGGADNDGKGAWTAFAEIGGDIGTSHSWQLGASAIMADETVTELGGHGHGHGGEEEEGGDAEFLGEATVYGVDFVYKWAPNGNAKQQNFKLQAEYFIRDLDGDIEIAEPDEVETTTLDASQSGFYIQGVWQFMPRWRVGLRYDQLMSDNDGSDEDVVGEGGFDDEGHDPSRVTAMIDWSHSEFSRVRLQVAQDDSRAETSDTQIFVQYIMSLGAHGAHRF